MVSLTATIPPDYALQDVDYLCNGSLKSNTTMVLDGGEHRISTICTISNIDNVTIMGSSINSTTIRCEEGSGLQFVSVQQLTLERVTFISCGIILTDTESTLIKTCIFQDSIATDYIGSAITMYGSTGYFSIQDCTFRNNRATYDSGGAVALYESTGNVSITNCTFQNNSATSDGGAVLLYGSTGNVSITSCTFQNNSASDGGAVLLYESTGNVSITNCTFQNNNATSYNGGAVTLYESTGNVSITNCNFQNNSATYAGGAVLLYGSTGNVSIKKCTFQNNSAAYSGGAVLLGGSTGNVSITNCTLQNNSANFEGGAVTLWGLTGNVSITNCTFQNNSATSYYGGAMGFDDSTGNVSITNCTFQNNSAYAGGGVWLYGSTGSVSITNCTFQNNSATYSGGAVLLWGSTGNVSITNCTLQNNSANFEGGAVTLWGLTGNVSITNCTFQNNSATSYYGGAMGFDGSTGNVSITNCTFQNNSAYAGGAVWLYGSTGSVSITNCTFQNNSAAFYGRGGAIYIFTADLVIIDRSTFINNTADRGAAVYALNDYSTNQLSHLTFQDVIVENNHCFCNGYPTFRTAAIYFSVMKVDIIGGTTTGSQFLYNSPLGAITGENGFLQLHGNVSFYNNTGENGGAISLSNNVVLTFDISCRVEFSRNVATGYSGVEFSRSVATGYGGAIYIDGGLSSILGFAIYSTGDPSSKVGLYGCIIQFIADFNGVVSSSITFTDNHAQQGGHAVYATPIYACQCRHLCIQEPCGYAYCETIVSYFTITSLPHDLNDTQVLSFPSYVQLCNCSDPDLCNATGRFEGKATTYPGGTVRLNVTPVDSSNYLSPSLVYASIGSNGDITTTIALGPGQEAQWIGTVCGTIEYQIYAPEMASLNLVLSTYMYLGSFPTVIEVELLPCKIGFVLMSNSSMCDCSPFLASYGIVCDASDDTVTINANNWIGVYNDTLPALASFCPLDYCKSTINKLSLSMPGDLCSERRTGIICGHCHGNYSVIFGSSQCQVCTDMWLSTLVMFAVLGALLVAALFFLNLTVTHGTLYGLIFYANIIQVNTSIFFVQSTLRPLQVVVSLVNLDLGIPLCFYDGMDDADKAGLQFVFPAYLLILTMTVIVLCHYCLQRSSTTSTTSCVYRVFIIIGQRAVGVLSTLIYLSYSKVLRSVIDVFTYSTVHLPSGDIYVWFYDGNVEYLNGKHTVIFVVAMVISVLFLLPYTFALTFIPIIEKYSEHNRLFNYLHKKANQIKPMIDAHYAPYKGEWRWWLGARLWLLVLMYILNSVLSSDKPSLLLSVQATVVILFTISQAGIKPFGQSLQKSENFNRRSNIFNQLYNSLDLFYLLNYIVLALSMSYILDQGTDRTQLVGVLVGLYIVVVMVTVLYHLIVAILKACGIYDRFTEKIDGLFQKQSDVVIPATNMASTINMASTTSFTVSIDERQREPLMYED